MAGGYTTLSVTPSYFYGEPYGASFVNVYEVPLTLRYHDDGWRASITVPLLTVSGPGIVSAGTLYGAPGSAGARTGLGDIWLESDFRLLHGHGAMPEISPYVLLKLPTGSRTRGLGTGTTDVGFGSSFYWRWSHFYPSIRLGYPVVGTSHGFHWRNTFLAELGGSYSFGEDGYATLLFEHRGVGWHNLPATEILLLAYTVPVTTRISLQAFALHGFTRSSVTYGAGLGAIFRF
jgi:hypothetical protein